MSQYITIPLSKRGKHAGKYETIVSDEDSDLLQFNWSVLLRKNGKQYAVRCTMSNYKQTYIYLHRVILERMYPSLEKTEDIDHINGDGLDNRRENLRPATRSQNLANRKIPNHNTSGLKGASWSKSAKKWIACITVKKKYIFLGHFNTAEEAHEAYCKAAKLHFGEFAKFD